MESKPISTKTHAILDYLTGILLLLAPNLLGFDEIGGAAVTIPRLLGLGIILLELTTDFELSLAKIVPVRIHLIVDLIAGAFLFISPFLFGFSDEEPKAWLPHLVVGLMIVGVSLLTKNSPERST